MTQTVSTFDQDLQRRSVVWLAALLNIADVTLLKRLEQHDCSATSSLENTGMEDLIENSCKVDRQNAHGTGRGIQKLENFILQQSEGSRCATTGARNVSKLRGMSGEASEAAASGPTPCAYALMLMEASSQNGDLAGK